MKPLSESEELKINACHIRENPFDYISIYF